ncbi:MAG: tRNA (adenosine(37)-N6)-threonylcarbamoyltransferase complex dimerization subunit type 1 TsaB [Deinococcales bacterium]|nr:tRNA (adenosine(37)-N6)-threonylcarbamoyltransferase complex dimerization subunit type 1 TsaB [Chitinophagaceae bacterium]
MGLLLHIDTATEYASVCVTNDGAIIGFAENADQKNHGAFLQPAIKKLFNESEFLLKNIDAISVSNGPGSYTGLRVGLTSAKGLCYALKKPLITINTLEVMAMAAIKESNNNCKITQPKYFCPLIDARRMEVFTAIYEANLNTILQPCAKIIDKNSFENYLKNDAILFSGNGHQKLKTVHENANANYSSVQHTAIHLSYLAELYFSKKMFANLAYCEPFYLKAFFLPIKT